VEEVAQCGVEEGVPEVLQEAEEASALGVEAAEAAVGSQEEVAVALHPEEEVVQEAASHEAVVRFLSSFVCVDTRRSWVWGLK